MATTKEVRAKFTADTKGFTSTISSANATLSKLRSELKLNATQAKSTGETIGGLSDRQRILAQELEASQTKIGAITSKLAEAKKAFGDTSPEVQRLETQLTNARISQERIQQEITRTNDALAKLGDENSKAASAMGELESSISQQEGELSRLKTQYNQVAMEQGEASDEARNLANQIKKTSGELQENKTKLDNAATAADKFDRTLDKLGDAARDAGKDLGTVDIAVGDFVSDVAQSGISALSNLESGTRDYRNEQSKLSAVAKNSNQDLGTLEEGFKNLYAITGDETLASTATLNMSAMGVSAKDQSTLVNAAAGAWAAYGDSIPLDGLLESINETSRAGRS